MTFLPEKKSFTITIHHKYHVYCANSSLLSSLPQHQQELATVLRQRCCDWPSFVSSYRSVYWYTARIDAASVQLEMPFCNKSQLYKVIRETRGHCTLQSLETRAPIRFVLECFLPCQSLTLRDGLLTYFCTGHRVWDDFPCEEKQKVNYPVSMITPQTCDLGTAVCLCQRQLVSTKLG